MPWAGNTKRKQERLAWLSFINQTYLRLGIIGHLILKCSLILRVPCLASDDKMFACLFVFSPCSRRNIFHFISHPMGVQSNERWVISVKRMNNPFFFCNKLWVIAANDRKNSWTGVTRKDRHQSTLVCLLGNCDIWGEKKPFKPGAWWYIHTSGTGEFFHFSLANECWFDFLCCMLKCWTP